MNYKTLYKYCIEKNVTLVAVSKTKPIDAIKKLYDEGQRIFGENKVQEILEKKGLLPSNIQWHLIGHLQTNKVKQILPHVARIHSVDSEKLLDEIQKQAQNLGLNIQVLLQMHIAKEETKFGLSDDELNHILDKYNQNNYPNISIKGVMGMATFTEDMEVVKSEFLTLKKIFDNSKLAIADKVNFTEISMGMSGDYALAIECGSTMVRIGSLLFGGRQ